MTYEVTKTELLLSNPQDDELTRKILAVTGDVCYKFVDDFGDGDVDVRYEWPEDSDRAAVVILGNDSWGAVIGARMFNGHLILYAHYGDDGIFVYSPTYSGIATDEDDPDGEAVNKLLDSYVARIALL